MVAPSDTDFARLFRTSLYSHLVRLESTRKRIVRRLLIVFGILACLGSIFSALAIIYRLSAIALLGGGALVSIGSILYRVIVGDYVRDFKASVIERIVRLISPDLTYWQNGHISAMQFNSSRIFTKYPDRITGNDMVEGKIGSTKVVFSEVHAQTKVETIDRYRRRRYSTIFRGLFFIADFNKHLVGKVVVLPDTAERLFGEVGRALQSLNVNRGELVKMDDPEFEKHFVVYADDQVEARYILSPSLMQRILDFKTRIGKSVYLSFVSSEVFVAIPHSRNLLEPPILSSLLSFENTKHYFEDLRLICGIVDDLNLNTRIWAKTQVWDA